MARKKLEDRNIRKISRSGTGSHYTTIPVEYIRELSWRKGQKIVIDLDKKRNRIIIKDWKK